VGARTGTGAGKFVQACGHVRAGVRTRTCGGADTYVRGCGHVLTGVRTCTHRRANMYIQVGGHAKWEVYDVMLMGAERCAWALEWTNQYSETGNLERLSESRKPTGGKVNI
jgi:hypothetical protein